MGMKSEMPSMFLAAGCTSGGFGMLGRSKTIGLVDDLLIVSRFFGFLKHVNSIDDTDTYHIL